MADKEKKKEKPELTESENTASARAALEGLSELPDYESAYGAKISELADRILRDEGFAYSLSSDPSYLSAREQAEIERRRAVSDAASNAAALTGGYANSYGAAASAEASAKSYDSLRSMIPALVDAAYKRWSDSKKAELERLDELRALERDSYSKYRDEVSDNRVLRDYLASRHDASAKSDLDRYKAALSDWQNERDYDRAVYEYDADAAYKASRDAAKDEQTAKQLAIDLIRANAAATNAAASYNKSVGSTKTEEAAAKETKETNKNEDSVITSVAAKKLVAELSSGALNADGTVTQEFVERVRKAKNAGAVSAKEYSAIMDLVRSVGTGA